MKTISEILAEANTNIETIKPHINNNYLRSLMEAAYVPEKKMVLPDGEPPYTCSPNHPDQISGAFWQIAKKISLFSRADLKPIRRESLFVQALESVSAMDASILLAVKNQTLDKMFPNLSKESLVKVGYFK
jgi:hypothetical protein